MSGGFRGGRLSVEASAPEAWRQSFDRCRGLLDGDERGVSVEVSSGSCGSSSFSWALATIAARAASIFAVVDGLGLSILSLSGIGLGVHGLGVLVSLRKPRAAPAVRK